MKEISVEQKTYITKWEAADGTQFDSNKECEKYENSAKCVVLAKYNDFIIKVSNAYEIFKIGSEDCRIDVVRVSDEKAIDAIFQTFCFFRDWVSDEGKEDVRNTIIRAWNYNDFLLIDRGYDLDNFYVIGTVDEIVEQIKEKTIPDEV